MGYKRFIIVEESDGTELPYNVEHEPLDEDIQLQASTHDIQAADLKAYFDRYANGDLSTKYVFHTTGANNGEVNYIEWYDTSTQSAGNLRFKVTLGYDGSLNPTSETWVIYDDDGSTPLKTVTLTHAWSGVDITTSTKVVS